MTALRPPSARSVSRRCSWDAGERRACSRVQANGEVTGGRAGDDRRAYRRVRECGEADAHQVVDAGVAIAREAGFEAEALLLAADRKTAKLIAATADELDAPAIVIGQRGMSGLKSALLGSVCREAVNAYHRPVVGV